MDRPATIALHILALCSFAIAQPLYDLLGSDAEFFVARRSEPIDLLIFALFLSLGVPAAIAFATLAIGLLGAALRRGAYLVCTALLSSCIALPILDRSLPLPGAVSVLLALGLGSGLAFALARVTPLRGFLTLLSGAALVFPALFLLTSPAASLLMPLDAEISASAVDSQTPIVIVLFDCLAVTALMTPDREIDAAAYPNFARIGRQSTWYRNATTVGISTELAVPALLTGRYPVHERLPIASHYPQNLFTWLGASRPVAALESTTHLCPDALCVRERQSLAARLEALRSDTVVVYLHLLLPADLSGGLPQIGTQWQGFGASAPASPTEAELIEETRRAREEPGLRRALLGTGSPRRLERIGAWLEELPQQPRHSLYYLHVYVPHGPFVFVPSGRSYVPPGSKLTHGTAVDDAEDVELRERLGERHLPWGRAWTSHEELIALASQRMLMQVGFADRIAGRIVEQLEQSDLWDPALVIVTSDHGESYNHRDTIRSLRDGNTAHVPLFVKLPGQRRGRIDDRNAETIDVLPTLAAALGVAPPWDMDGASLLADDVGRATKRMYTPLKAEWAERSWPDSGLPEALARLNELVGPLRTTEALLRLGPRPDLLGRRSAALGLGALRSRIQQRELLARVDPASSFVPAYLTGSIAGPGLAGGAAELAVAINGIVRATTWSFRDAAGRSGFAVLVPEEAYRGGANRVELFAIPPPPPSL